MNWAGATAAMELHDAGFDVIKPPTSPRYEAFTVDFRDGAEPLDWEQLREYAADLLCRARMWEAERA